MSSSDPADWSLIEARDAIAGRHVSAREVTEACLDRLADVDPAIRAVAGVDEEDALNQATAADAKQTSGAALGPLHGVPLAHKDMYYREGRISACGSKIRADFRPDFTGTALSKLDAAGALDIARLNMVEFAFGVTGHNEVAGTPRNPWNTAHMTGGSSSGSGAGVAAGIALGSLGSDTGGSVRLPAACCGLTGMKPTYGRVSRHGVMPLSFSLDVVGPLTRTVADNALMLQTIAGHDPKDATTGTRPVPDYMGTLGDSVRGLKIGVPKSYFYEPADPDVETLVRASLDVLEYAGCEAVPVDIPDWMAITNRLTNLMLATEGAAIHANWLADRSGEYGAQTRARITIGLFTPANRYIQVLGLRKRMLKEMVETVFSQVDALHSPLMVCPVPTIEESDVAANPDFAEYLLLIGHCTRPANFLGLPALTVPCGFTPGGLPCGFQLMGRPFDEDILYRLGHTYQQATDWHTQRPPLP